MKSIRNLRFLGSSAAAAWAIVTGGCGASGPELAPVSGVVTFDGKPLSGAWVKFYPPDGRPSEGRCDASGRYVLQYTWERPGAVVGEHTVAIGTAEPTGGDGKPVPETIPAKYNSKSELAVEVVPGSNLLDIELTTH